MKTDISVIVPFLNEEDNIHDLCRALDGYAQDKPYRLEVLFVDDGSTDRSVEPAEGISLFVYTGEDSAPLEKLRFPCRAARGCREGTV